MERDDTDDGEHRGTVHRNMRDFDEVIAVISPPRDVSNIRTVLRKTKLTPKQACQSGYIKHGDISITSNLIGFSVVIDYRHRMIIGHF